MKKAICLFALVCIALTSSAQLKVASNGKIALGSTTNPISQLAFGAQGNNYARTYFEGDGYVMQIKPLGKSSNMSSSMYGKGVYVKGNPVQGSGLVGVHSDISGTYSSSNGFAIGVLGSAGNGSNGYNYAISGYLGGVKNGAAIFGSVSGNGISTYIPGRYAGFFAGNVFLEGDLLLDQSHFYQFSNEDFMPNKQLIGSVLNKVMSINPLVYKFPSSSDSIYALSAQNINMVFPSLVSSDEEFVDYMSMIPILIKTIKEMQQEIETLQTLISGEARQECGQNSTSMPLQQSLTNEAILYQNSPNPFFVSTTIRFELPEHTQNAYIFIFDMSGKMQKQIPINSSMESITIDGYELSAGMYIYSLVIGGKEIQTRRMILSK